MEYAGNVSGSKPHVRKYQVDGGVTLNAGEPVITGESVADNGGVTVATTTAAVGTLGIASADATSTDAQSGTSANNVNLVSVVVNPDAMWRAKLSGGAAEDTATTLLTAAAEVTAGTTITGATDEFTIWALDGANAGSGWRRATGAATVVVAFPQTIAAADTFSEVSPSLGSRSQGPTLTTLLTQVAGQTAVAALTNFNVVDFLLRDAIEDGRTNSYVFLVAQDHAIESVGTT